MIVLENFTMPNVDLAAVMQHLIQTGKRTHQLRLNDDTLAFVARGREYRSEFHINPSYEIQYSLKGAQDLLYRTDTGEIKMAHMPEGTVFCQPPFVPHSPRFAPDAFQFIIERVRKPGEIDAFQWFCPNCDHLIHEETFFVDDYRKDPVSRAYDRYYSSLAFRTCGRCGTQAPGRD